MTGPWRMGETYEDEVPGVVYAIYDAAGGYVGDTGYTGDAETRKANAVLMAAAPELLKALEALLADADDASRDAARAAIEKARG